MGEDQSNDFAVAAYRHDGVWQVAPLPRRAGEDLCSLLAVLRQLPGDVGSIALVSVHDEFFVAARMVGSDARILLSDASAGREWQLAREVLDRLDDEGSDGVGEVDAEMAAGDLDLFADLGLGAQELEDLCDDLDLYPDEACGEIAARLGFGPQFHHMLDHVHDAVLR